MAEEAKRRAAEISNNLRYGQMPAGELLRSGVLCVTSIAVMQLVVAAAVAARRPKLCVPAPRADKFVAYLSCFHDAGY